MSIPLLGTTWQAPYNQSKTKRPYGEKRMEAY